ncbi:hypothetical protein CI109_103991 [Kwoniella shandongensis]|uniref:Ribonuclease H2 subunit B n=1 Tax=Kwoniella shandongensis TaxID=1734106 RepID=A0A5M6C1V5_9TREE|nr:uncharacterized protein CI109_004124 [Kwoniella shandongensis]KAA5527585.1 hypothetical protein CI109_004124 [Kwoniella shandongensis]
MDYISIVKDDVDLSKSNRYLRLPHPRTGQAQLYLPYTTSTGIESVLEVVKINGSHRRTWFIGESGIDAGSILIHYPIDPLFLVIPLILALIPNGASPPPFQPLSDLISAVSTSSQFSLSPPFVASSSKTPSSYERFNEDLSTLLETKSVRKVFKACCEKKVVPMAPPSPPTESQSESQSSSKQRYYRPSLPLIINHLKKKVEYFAREEEFEKFDHLVRGLGRDGLLDAEADKELLRLARLKAGCEHLAQWLPPAVLPKLVESYDFTTLNTYLANRTAASMAASQQPSTGSGKEAKGVKRKAAPASRGVEALKKVNTNNMAKLTSFFKPKEGKEKEPAKKKK